MDLRWPTQLVQSYAAFNSCSMGSMSIFTSLSIYGSRVKVRGVQDMQGRCVLFKKPRPDKRFHTATRVTLR
jgi:hypothetical protein